jgi:iron complex outermembrane receptor protein
VQDEVRLAPPLRVTLGLKAERNAYTGWEWLPTLRAAYDLAPERMVWASLSRAVRAPARLDRDFYLPSRPPFAIQGGPDFDSEVATVAEAGYRGQHSTLGNLSVTLFSGDYQRLRGGTPGRTFIENRIRERMSGAEAWDTVELSPRWRMSLGWTALHPSFSPEPGTSPTSPSDLGNDPRVQWLVRSNADLPAGVEFDLQVRHVSRLPQPAVASYTETDLRLSKRLARRWTLTAMLRNALDDAHIEFNAPTTASEIRRAVYLQLEWRAP